MSFEEKKIKKIQAIDIYSNQDWDSGMYPYMTPKQIVDCVRYIFSNLMKSVTKLRGSKSIMDLACHGLCRALIEELDKRLGVKRD